MCGIYGTASLLSKPDKRSVQTMIHKCSYRGPDNKKVWSDDTFSLGHNLLQITGELVTESTQPWKTPHGNILIYNGEIFNYADLIKKYTDFIPKTTCDTELLAWGLDNVGLDFIGEIDSMHAFAYYKPGSGSIYLSRDHVGIKPLYYIFSKDTFYFASEIKALLPHCKNALHFDEDYMDRMAFSCWAYCGLNVTPNTFYKHIYKVSAGTTVKYNIKAHRKDCIQGDVFHKKRAITHFSTEVVRKDRVIGGENNKVDLEEFRHEFRTAVKNSMLGNQPTGIFLSGGLDSTMIAHEVNKIKQAETFTTRIIDPPKSKEDFNSDADCAFKLAELENYKHHIINHSTHEYAEYFKKSIEVAQEPIYNMSLPMYFQANMSMKANGIKVTLAGDMGDEILAGYSSYYALREKLKNKKMNHDELVKFWLTHRLGAPPAMFLSDEIPYSIDRVAEYLAMTTFSEDLFDENDIISSYMRFDQVGLCAEDYFRRNDRFGMIFSMEGRFPFASKRFMTYCMNIHSKDKMHEQYTKNSKGKMLSQLAYKNILPDFIINKTKTGWTSPVSGWCKHNTRGYSKIEECFNKKSKIGVSQKPSGKAKMAIEQYNLWRSQGWSELL